MKKLNANRFHILMFILWQFALFFCAQQLFPIFYNYYPDRRCDDAYGPGIWNVSTDECMPIHSEQCELLKNCHNVSVINADFHGIVEYFGLYCGDKSYSATLVSTLQFVGVLCGTITYGHLGDHFGRKPVSLFGITFGMICGIVSGLAVSWEMYAVLRFFVGTSIACILVVFYTYVIELILPEQRVFLRSFFNWGYARLLFTLVCFLLPYWRLASIVTALLVLPVIPIVAFLLPESPKWYSSKRRISDAEIALKRLNFITGRNCTRTVSIGAQKVDSDNVNQHVFTIKDLLVHRKLAFRTVVMCFLWFATSLSAFGSDLNSGNLGGDFYLNQFVMSLATAFSKIAVYLLDSYVPKFSRRLLHQIPQALMVLCYAAIMFIMMFAEQADCEEKSTAVDWTIVIINIVGVSLIEITWDACYLCAAESFPTEMRAIGMGTCSLLARIGALIAPQMAFMSAYYQAAPYILVVIVGLISLIVSIAFLSDTKGIELCGLKESATSEHEMCNLFDTARTTGAVHLSEQNSSVDQRYSPSCHSGEVSDKSADSNIKIVSETAQSADPPATNTKQMLNTFYLQGKTVNLDESEAPKHCSSKQAKHCTTKTSDQSRAVKERATMNEETVETEGNRKTNKDATEEASRQHDADNNATKSDENTSENS